MTHWAIAVVATLLCTGCLSGPDPQAEDQPWTNPFLQPGMPVRIQVDYVEGRMPSAFATDSLLQIMADVGTPAVLEMHGTLPAKGSTYDSHDLGRLHRASYAGSPKTWLDADGIAVLHVLYLDANYSTPGVRGLVSPGFPLISIFPDDLSNLALFATSATVSAPLPEGFERAVLVHEYGHVLGLVGCELPETRHRRTDDGTCHSVQQSSVMWPSLHQSGDLKTWAVDDERQPVWRFDADDWADIRAGQALLEA